ncbi:hypothetical protein YC2023_100398 [Brassica napus]|uniref:(rape) hypothetical protein n=1 Tax=Brassica napus TaxID=3708 RepID=A0A816U0F6_BRANA|nr:unnamed protein product [Brassica napus]
MGDSDDDDYVDIGRPDLVGLLPDEIDELFSTIQPEHLELIVKDSDFEKAVGTTREGSFKLSDLVELELWNELSGPIRNQKRHILCWAYSSTDLVSALRVLKFGGEFVPLSTWYLNSYVSPDLRGQRPNCVSRSFLLWNDYPQSLSVHVRQRRSA